MQLFSNAMHIIQRYAYANVCISKQTKWRKIQIWKFRDYLLVLYRQSWQSTNTAQPSPSKKRQKFRFIFKFCHVLRFNDRLSGRQKVYVHHFMCAMRCVWDLNKRQYRFAQIKNQMHFHRCETTSFRLLWKPHGGKCVVEISYFSSTPLFPIDCSSMIFKCFGILRICFFSLSTFEILQNWRKHVSRLFVRSFFIPFFG